MSSDAPSTSQTDSVQKSSPPMSVRAALSSFIGTAIEWYDYYLYGTAAALIFPQVFFSGLPSGTATLVSLASFGIAFLFRPLGGAIFGHFGDRLGRKQMLIITLVGMGIGTGVIGLIPNAATIGIAAPIALTVLRALQGVALGGEWGGAALVTVEHAPARRRGLFGSTTQMGVPAGLLLSTAMVAIMSTLPDPAFFSWGWRVPFLISFALVFVGLYIRLSVTESPAFTRVRREGTQPKFPLAEVFKHARRTTIQLIFVQSACNVGFFLVSVYSLTYITEYLHLPRNWAVNALLAAAALDLVLQPVFGMLSDRFGRRKVYGGGVVFLGLYAFPFFALLNTGNQVAIWVAIIVGLAIGHGSTGSLHCVLYAEQYPARYRYSGASVSYQLSGVVSSAATPLIAAWLVQTAGSPLLVAGYLVLAAAVSLLCVLLMRESYRVDIER